MTEAVTRKEYDALYARVCQLEEEERKRQNSEEMAHNMLLSLTLDISKTPPVHVKDSAN